MLIDRAFQPSNLADTTAQIKLWDRNLILVGLMGSGKSTIGAACARELNYDFCDTDRIIEHQAGKTIAQIFEQDGELAFRVLESSVLQEICQRERVVIATGGGAPVNADNAARLKASGVVVHLSARPDVIVKRIRNLSTRPLIAESEDPTARLAALLKQRQAAYSAVSEQTVDTNTGAFNTLVNRVCSALRSTGYSTAILPVHATSLTVELGERSYPLWLAHGIVTSGAGRLIAALPSISSACIVTHPHLQSKYAEPIARELRSAGLRCAILTIPPGENHKHLRTVEKLYAHFAKTGIDRKGVVIAVGGGVIGDMVGFAAASYLRGVRFVQVPTTLLAQVDSSVGGKTGVDLPEGKNLVGAFHQPTIVLLDPTTLKTLPTRELRSGLAEVIKYGIICDKAFFDWIRTEIRPLLAADPAVLERAIARSCEIKAAIVSEDETEQGVRAFLNFGHTVGHAVESVTRYSVYRHGEAIAIGMVAACLVGEELGITPASVTEEVTAALCEAGLPVGFPAGLDMRAIHQAMLLDKKTHSGRLRFVLAESIGSVKVVDGVPPEAVERAIQRQSR